MKAKPVSEGQELAEAFSWKFSKQDEESFIHRHKTKLNGGKLLGLLCLFGLVSCAHESHVSQKLPVLPQEQGNLVEMAQEKMDLLIQAAIEAGPSAIEYVSSDFYLKARMASQEGDYVTSLLLLKSLIKLHPDDLFLKKQFAFDLIRSGEIENALTHLEDLNRHEKGKDIQVGMVLGGAYTSQNKLREARLVYRQILKNYPKNEDACLYLSKSYQVEEQFKTAHQVLLKCERKDSKNGLYAFERGKVYLQKGLRKKALNFFLKAIKKSPDLNKAVLGAGLIYEDEGKAQKAAALYDDYLDSDPGNMIILNRLVQIYFAEGMYDEVIPYATRLSQMLPDDLNLQVKLGILYTDKKDYAKAIAIFKKLHDKVPDSDKVTYYLASIYQEQKDYQKAVDLFQTLTPESALYHDGHLQIAQMLQNIGLKSKNNEDIERFIDFTQEFRSKIPEIAVEFAVIEAGFYEDLNRHDQAVEALMNVRAKDNFDESHQYYLASLLEKVERYDEAIDLVKEIIKKNPKNAHALNFLGYSYLERGNDYEQAYQYISKALAFRPDDGFILDSMGWYYYKVGQYQKALKKLLKARKSVSNDSVISKHLALVYEKFQNYDKAKKYYNEALSLSVSTKEKDEIKNALHQLEKLRLPASKKLTDSQ